MISQLLKQIILILVTLRSKLILILNLLGQKIKFLILGTDYNSKITEIENKIPDVSGLATKTALTPVEHKIPSITNLATKAALTTVESKIPSTSKFNNKN